MLSPSVLIYSRWDLLGDALLKLPAIRRLRQAFPGYRITWMCGERATVFSAALAPLVTDYIDEVIGDAGLGVGYGEVLRRPWRQEYYDIVIDTQKKLKTTLLLKVGLRHGCFISACAGFRLSDERPQRPLPKVLPEYIMGLINLAAGSDLQPDYHTRLPGEYLQAATAALPEGPCYVGLCPGAGGRRKCWPLARYIELGQHVARLGAVPVYFIGPAEREWLEPIRAAIPSALFPDAAPCQGIAPGPLLSIALATRLRVSVANDSGGGHLLSAGNNPVITLFGPYNPAKFAPPSATRIVLTAQEFGSDRVSDIPFAAVIDRLNPFLPAGAA